MRKKVIFTIAIPFLFSHVFGQTWTQVGSGFNNSVFSLTVDSLNNLLYAGGYFTKSGSTVVNHISKWDGNAWLPLDSGLNGYANSIIMYKGELYAGGGFSKAGNVSVKNIAKWNGVQWSALGAGVNSSVRCFYVNNGLLYVGGTFTTAGSIQANHIATWDGANWDSIGQGVSGAVIAIMNYNGNLYEGGTISTIGTTDTHLAYWNGTKWNAVAEPYNTFDGDDWIKALAVYQGDLMIGGYIDPSTMLAMEIVKWNGSNWLNLGGSYLSNDIESVNSFISSDSALYIGGGFSSAYDYILNTSTSDCKGVTRWQNNKWHSFDKGITSDVSSIVFFNGELYAGGSFNTSGGLNAGDCIMKWNMITSSNDLIADSYLLHTIFPNPFISNTTLKLNSTIKEQGVNFKMYNSIGEEVTFTYEFIGEQIKIIRGDLPSGLYFIQLISSNKIIVSEKLIMID